MEEFENAKSEIIKGLKELSEGKATDFPNYAFFECVFYLANQNKENFLFAKRIYHVLGDLFHSTKSFYSNFLKVDNVKKTVTVERHIAYHDEVKHSSKIEKMDYKDNPQLFALYENKSLEFLNEETKSHSEHKYEELFKEKLNIDAKINIDRIKTLYKKDTLSIALDKSISSITFEGFIDIYCPKEKITTTPQKSKVVKNPNADQRKFLKAYVEYLKDGYKKTYAIESACQISNYSTRQGKNIDGDVRKGLIKYEPLSEILYNEKKQNNED